MLQHSINDAIIRHFIILLVKVVNGLLIYCIVRYVSREEYSINRLSVRSTINKIAHIKFPHFIDLIKRQKHWS